MGMCFFLRSEGYSTRIHNKLAGLSHGLSQELLDPETPVHSLIFSQDSLVWSTECFSPNLHTEESENAQIRCQLMPPADMPTTFTPFFWKTSNERKKSAKNRWHLWKKAAALTPAGNRPKVWTWTTNPPAWVLSPRMNFSFCLGRPKRSWGLEEDTGAPTQNPASDTAFPSWRKLLLCIARQRKVNQAQLSHQAAPGNHANAFVA